MKREKEEKGGGKERERGRENEERGERDGGRN